MAHSTGWYDAHAPDLVGRYEAVDPATLHSWLSANLASRDHDLLVGKLARADTDDATTLGVNHARLLQHRRGPQAV